LPDGAFVVSDDGRRAVLTVEQLPLIDSFRFMGPNETLATVSFSVEWQAVGRQLELGSGATVDLTDPAAFLGQFHEARAVGTFSGSELGFSFASLPGASSDATFAELGRERNGVFLR
jgi:hypothetical protein